MDIELLNLIAFDISSTHPLSGFHERYVRRSPEENLETESIHATRLKAPDIDRLALKTN